MTSVVAAQEASKIPEAAGEPGNQMSRLWITASAAVRQVKSHPSVVLVDIRDPGSVHQVGIPGALNIPPHFIRTKQHLKQSTLILVGEGYGYRLALNTCVALQKAGFNARVLFGGLPAWRAADGPVEGDLTALAQYQYIPPSAFHIDLADGLILPIRSMPADVDKKNDLQGVICLDMKAAPKELAKQLEGVNRKMKTQVYQTPVVIDAVPGGPGVMDAALTEAGIGNVRCLKGGMAAYQQHLGNIKRLGKSRDQRLMVSGNQLPCAEEINKQPTINQ